MYLSPVLFTSAQISSHSSRLVAMGTVHITCLPAFSAAMDMVPWSPMGELMCTKSTTGSASTSSYRV